MSILTFERLLGSGELALTFGFKQKLLPVYQQFKVSEIL